MGIKTVQILTDQSSSEVGLLSCSGTGLNKMKSSDFIIHLCNTRVLGERVCVCVCVCVCARCPSCWLL